MLAHTLGTRYPDRSIRLAPHLAEDPIASYVPGTSHRVEKDDWHPWKVVAVHELQSGYKMSKPTF
jgi:hypothetical protein